MRRVGVVLHPTRPVREALETLQRWATSHALELVRVQAVDSQSRAAPPGEVGACDVVVAIGGDGTVLMALHAAARTQTPVLGVACGTLGALSTVSPAELRAALDRIAAGEWLPRPLPALVVETAEGRTARAINDLVLVRRGASQLIVGVWVRDDLYVRLAGDGVVIATPLGSSAYSMSAGGSLLVEGTDAFVCTPLAMHGGWGPPLVVGAEREVTLQVEPGYGGFDVEVDGQQVESTAKRFGVSIQDGYATLVGFGDSDTGLPGLRRRGLITDSPRVLARDGQAARPGADATSG
jgi:NAD+ kinase